MQEPQLARPGAGLPFIEGLVSRYWIVPRYSRRMSWDESSQFFVREAEKILALATPLSEAQMVKKVLIPRVKGLEDSSRYWSAAMVLEHLLIVTRAMSAIIIELSQGRVPPIEVDIAKIKPLGARKAKDVLSEFKDLAKAQMRVIDARVGDRASPLKHAHPWFGQLTAHQWHWLVCSHLYVHRKQLEEINKGNQVVKIVLKGAKK